MKIYEYLPGNVVSWIQNINVDKINIQECNRIDSKWKKLLNPKNKKSKINK